MCQIIPFPAFVTNTSIDSLLNENILPASETDHIDTDRGTLLRHDQKTLLIFLSPMQLAAGVVEQDILATNCSVT